MGRVVLITILAMLITVSVISKKL
ncbi:hypothetical protein pdam_00025626 [Pocillopora damicornis]|uniref:Uncharacterized protein n=1 Tax=Pocillopora damicornis TaxID=46731 RepID=A0A3M6TC17_POCDA|nr:hypothetical protein pdam_00025626 [Pocillopora damicornis]